MERTSKDTKVLSPLMVATFYLGKRQTNSFNIGKRDNGKQACKKYKTSTSNKTGTRVECNPTSTKEKV